MGRKRVAFGIVGVLVGFVLGFFAGQLVNQQPGPPVGSAAVSGRQQVLPEGHPSIDTLKEIEQMEAHAAESPDHAEIRARLGSAYFELQQYEQSVKWFQEAARLEPDNVDLNSNLGTAYYAQGNIKKAVETFERSLQMEADNAVALQNLGWIYYSTDQQAKAIRFWEKLVKTHPDWENIEAVREHLKKARDQLKGKPA